MSLRFAALALSTVLLAACQSGPAAGPWLMAGDQPWVGADGKCMQLRPLRQNEKSGFCYDVMSDAYQKQHHYEPLSRDEFAFLYPKVDPTSQDAYNLPLPELPQELASVNAEFTPLPSVKQIFTSLPFRFNNAHLSSKNRESLRESFNDWHDKGLRVVSVTVTGHTDRIGPVNYNLLLSKWRAQSVAYFLKHLGIPQQAITQGGVGMQRPLPNAHSEADNRYVDLQVWLAPTKFPEPVATR